MEDRSRNRNVLTPTALAGKRIALVEDEALMQLHISKALTRAGLSVAGCAVNGEDGVHLVLEERPDLVLMDIKMPVMDGLEASRRILASYHVCIVMLTAFDLPEYEEQARLVGAAGYLLKPIDRDALLPQLEAIYQTFHSA